MFSNIARLPRTAMPHARLQPRPSSPRSEGWAAIEHCRLYLVDPRLTPVPVPAHLLPGFHTMRNGRPCRRFTVDGFDITASVVPSDRDGRPFIVWVDGAMPSSLKIID